MKKIVTFEQATILKELKRCFYGVSHGYTGRGYCHGRGHVNMKEGFPAPTIGELIEWIDENQDRDLTIRCDKRGCEVNGITSPELIDALFQLVCKIQEENNG